MKGLLWVLFASGIVIMSCGKKDFDINVLRTPRDYSIEEARDVEILYSDSAVLRVRIEGPMLRRYVYRFRVEEEFPEGINLAFFDGTTGRQTAWLASKYALRRPQDHKTIARDSVVLYNTLGEKIEALELIWDEKEEMIYTEKFVKITRPDEIIYSRGFKSNQDFTKYTFYAPEGHLLFEDLGLDDDDQKPEKPKKADNQ